MDPILIIALGCAVSFIIGRSLYAKNTHHREWACVHQGKRIQLIAKETELTLMVDGILALQQPIESKNRFVRIGINGRIRRHFRIAVDQESKAFDGQVIQIQSGDWKMQNDYDINCKVGGTLIPLVELKNRTEAELNDTFYQLSQSTHNAISDPRWAAAETLISESLSGFESDPETISVINRLSSQLRKRIELSEMLKRQEIVTESRQETARELTMNLEAEIESTLESLRRLHFIALEKRHQEMDASELSEIEQSIQILEAEVVVDKVMREPNKQARMKAIEKHFG